MSAIEPVPIIPPRPKLTKAQRVRVFDQGGGRCYLCELPIQFGEDWHAEHPEFRAGGGSDKIEELRPAHVDCHKPKSKKDAATLAKTNRVRAKHLSIKRVAPTPQIQSAPFPTTAKAAKRAAQGHKEPLTPLKLFRDVRPA